MINHNNNKFIILKLKNMQFQFKIQIKGITKPPVWRRITIPANFSFFDLHIAIQVSFGWEHAHLFQFSPKGYGSRPIIKEYYEDDVEYGIEAPLNAEELRLSEIFTNEKQKFTYIYDFGDSWWHNIVLEKILPDIAMYPRLLGGKGKCPMEDCGGVWGYEELKETLSDKTKPEYEEVAEWCGLEENETWNPEEFNLDETQQYLTEVFLDHKN